MDKEKAFGCDTAVAHSWANESTISNLNNVGFRERHQMP